MLGPLVTCRFRLRRSRLVSARVFRLVFLAAGRHAHSQPTAVSQSTSSICLRRVRGHQSTLCLHRLRHYLRILSKLQKPENYPLNRNQMPHNFSGEPPPTPEEERRRLSRLRVLRFALTLVVAYAVSGRTFRYIAGLGCDRCPSLLLNFAVTMCGSFSAVGVSWGAWGGGMVHPAWGFCVVFAWCS